MDPQTENTMSPVKQAQRKKGYIYLVIAIVLFILSYSLFEIGVDGGVILALINLAMLILLVMAIVFLIRGYWGKG